MQYYICLSEVKNETQTNYIYILGKFDDGKHLVVEFLFLIVLLFEKEGDGIISLPTKAKAKPPTSESFHPLP